MKIQPPKTAKEIRLRRQELLNELRDAIPIHRKSTNKELLDFCNIPNKTLVADCTSPRYPWAIVPLHYHTLGINAVNARASDRFPDGSLYGSDNSEATTPPYIEIIEKQLAEDAAKRRRRA